MDSFSRPLHGDLNRRLPDELLWLMTKIDLRLMPASKPIQADSSSLLDLRSMEKIGFPERCSQLDKRLSSVFEAGRDVLT